MGLSMRKVRLRLVWLLVIPFFVFSTPSPNPLLIGVVLAAVGLFIRGWSAGTIHKDEELTTTGPYAFTRNPLYLGTLVLGLGLQLRLWWRLPLWNSRESRRAARRTGFNGRRGSTWSIGLRPSSWSLDRRDR